MKYRHGVGVVILNDLGQYLLHLRDDVPGIWSPGEWSIFTGGVDPKDGKLDDLKTFYNAALRELKEEVGLEVDINFFYKDFLSSVGMYRYFYRGIY